MCEKFRLWCLVSAILIAAAEDATKPVTEAMLPVTETMLPVTDAMITVVDAMLPVADAMITVTDAVITVTDAKIPETDAIVEPKLTRKVTTLDLHNGLKMPILGLGTWKAEAKELEPALDAALEAGYRHIDTASVYGNEDVIGRVLKRWLDAGKVKREDLFIVTKLPPGGNRPSGVNKFLTRSLEALQLDYVDMYLVHAPFGVKDHEEDPNAMNPDGRIGLDFTTDHAAIWKAMEEQVEKGRTKSIGLSNFNQTQIERILKIAKIKPSNLQIELHAYHQQTPLVEFCKNNSILVTAYSPLGSPGLGKWFEDNFGMKVDIPDILGNPVIKQIADKHKKTPAQVLIRQIIQRGIVVIPKSTNAGRIKQNIDVFDFELDADDMAKIKALDRYPKVRLLNFTVFKGVKDHPEYPWHGE